MCAAAKTKVPAGVYVLPTKANSLGADTLLSIRNTGVDSWNQSRRAPGKSSQQEDWLLGFVQSIQE